MTVNKVQSIEYIDRKEENLGISLFKQTQYIPMTFLPMTFLPMVFLPLWL